MNRLLDIARSATPCTGVQFCENAYGAGGIERFLRDVLAMANAYVDGKRYIVTGISFDKNQQKRIETVDHSDFCSKPSYQALVAEFIEPPFRIKYEPVMIAGHRVGVFEIGDCRDRPYMMRVDYSEQLRRGDAYMRVGHRAIKIGRRVLFRMFDDRPRNIVSEDTVEIGFPGEIIQKKLHLPTADMNQLPSAIEHAKLDQLIDARKNAKNTGSTTTMARLVHMRLFGSDDPYEDRSPTGLMVEMEQIQEKCKSDDRRFLFEENAQKLQLVVYNQGDEQIQNASVTLMMPNHEALYVATRLAAPDSRSQDFPNGPFEIADYPVVSARRNKIYVSSTLGEIPAGVPVDAFECPLRICVGSELDGMQLTLRYRLFGSNIRQPVEGRLQLAFHRTRQAESIVTSVR